MFIRAYVNFALIKYWGKKDEELKLPNQASLSFTVDKLYTETKVTYDKTLKKDIITINGISDNETLNKRVIKHMDFIRKKYSIKDYAIIESVNYVPTAAGLASSASAFAALSIAATKAANLKLTKKELSKLARVGSGSASRSIYGDFAMWQVGNDETSVAKKLDVKWNEFAIIVCMLDKNEKKHSSSLAMKESVEKSPLYDLWVKRSKIDLENMLKALTLKNIDKVGMIAENNAIAMHELIESTGIKYRTDESDALALKIKDMRKKGIKAYYTMDAGPNIKIITIKDEVDKILDELKDIETLVCHAGLDAHEV